MPAQGRATRRQPRSSVSIILQTPFSLRMKDSINANRRTKHGLPWTIAGESISTCVLKAIP